MQEFVAQIKGATHVSFTRSDDGPDLITMALVTMHVYYPSYEVPLKQMTTKDGTYYYETTSTTEKYSAYDSY